MNGHASTAPALIGSRINKRFHRENGEDISCARITSRLRSGVARSQHWLALTERAKRR